MKSPLRILLLEDNPRDAELIQELLEADHFVCEVTRVQTRAEFVAGLENAGIELILADYQLPSFDGLSALTLALDARPDLPFIFVSGTLGDELAIDAVKIGATDYVVKSRLSRLVPSVQRALREARERMERKKAEEALRRSEMYLAEAQRMSRTGSFGWDPVSGEIYWSDETYRIFECAPAMKPTVQLVLDRTHPDDRMRLREIIDRVSIERSEFTAEHRLLMADGSVKYVRAVAHPSTGEDAESLVFVGAITDITERKRAEEERGESERRYHELQMKLAHANRVATIGQLSASIAHEVNQPLSGIVTNASTCLRMLAADPPNVDGARETVRRAIRDANRASDVITRLRALFTKKDTLTELMDLNEAIREVVALSLGELQRNRVILRSEFAPDLPPVVADRVQLQQVILNLLRNASDAMSAVDDRPRQLLISTTKTKSDGVLVAVQDSGLGVDPANLERIFDAFYTTKPGGLGMGLSICRAIVEVHGGKLWAITGTPQGAIFQFTLPPSTNSTS